MAEEVQDRQEEVVVPEAPEPVDYVTLTQDRFRALRAAGELPPQAEPGSDAPVETPADEAPAVDETPAQAETPSETDDETKPPRLQKRINALTRRAKEAEAREAALAARLQALESGPPRPSEPTVPAETAQPDPDDFETHDAYVAAMARHEARALLQEERENEAAQRTLAAQQARLQEARGQLQRSIEEARETYDDFDDVMETSDAEPSPLLKQAVAYNDKAGLLGYQLLKHPDEMERLSAIEQPHTLLRELARFEARVLPDAASEEPAPQVRRTPSAPTPARPPTGDRSGGGTPKRPEDMTYAEYKKYRQRSA